MLLINLGPDISKVDPTLLRIAYKLEQQDIKIIYRPFATLRLLDGFERVYYRNLIADQVEEAEAEMTEQAIESAEESATRRQVFEKKLDISKKQVENNK